MSGFGAYVLVFLASLLYQACTTSKRYKKPVAPPYERESVALSEAQQMSLYHSMAELKSPAPPPGVINSTRGHVLCDLEEDACVAVAGGGRATVDGDVEEELIRYLREVHPELANEKQVIINVGCDYVGEKSPPYNGETASCYLRYPRAEGEHLLTGAVAAVLWDVLGRPETLKPGRRFGIYICKGPEGRNLAHCEVGQQGETKPTPLMLKDATSLWEQISKDGSKAKTGQIECYASTSHSTGHLCRLGR